ncbi:hypothetical protein [Micromonospora sp. WMMD998]|uniref:hypothetical protein n=1 Tax=Micromonospora sp. WMMD998 TaxID=3016092 RepID=UPI00249C298A|nr:hypothetical protein [Micromonospora sp. WMMD998]WFE39789.1 hypothetical protein O7619_15680 [Micromonospora sp. WMMD998]
MSAPPPTHQPRAIRVLQPLRRPRGRARTAMLAALATAHLLLAACGAGQIAETAVKDPSIQGVNLASDNGEYAVRGLLLPFPGVDGYRASANAPLYAVIYNDSKRPVTVTVTTQDARDIVIVGAEPPLPPAGETPPATRPASPPGSRGPAASPTPTATTSGPPAMSTPRPARFDLPPLSFVRFNEQTGRHFQLLGLNEALRSGQNAMVTFDFGNGQQVSGPAPVAAPLTPVAPPPPIIRPGGAESQQENGQGG